MSVIERTHAGGVLRFVLWCSLRGSEQHCAESCLIDPGAVDEADAAGPAPREP